MSMSSIGASTASRPPVATSEMSESAAKPDRDGDADDVGAPAPKVAATAPGVGQAVDIVA